ncbi:hypothetical protein J3Q64DRAFT_1108157 [Phycomyces blakesleeanus]|uniref:C3H1-type domain-containing protein n=1 Tax=Phycomyces blakesleeanus TaxID=4837 RepID=A0ABR3AZ67_PHYBL
MQTLQGQIRHLRKLYRCLFFIDLQPEEGEKVQVFFRCDDGSMNNDQFQDAYKTARLGDQVKIQVEPPHDPKEADRPYVVYQSCQPIVVLSAYKGSFVADSALKTGENKKETLRQWDGQHIDKASLNCKYWINQRRCPKMEACMFQHPVGEAYEQAREEWLKQRMDARKLNNHDPKDPHTNKKPHALRAIVFAKWILSTFQPSGQVLDIAGGKGEIAMVLSRGYGIPATVVEPQERKRPDYWYTRLLRLLRTSTWPFDVEPIYLHTMLDNAFVEDQAALINSASLFIGLHADQATEPIVDCALSLNKAFAVVPCCVFGQENRHRRLKDNRPVLTTQDLVQYLCEKETPNKKSVQQAYLDFEGKNIVVYWNPDE